MAAVVAVVGERRRFERCPPDGQRVLVHARLRPGHHVRIVNISACGALVESARRLLPGARVELHFDTPARRHAPVRAVIVRSFVAALQPRTMVFCGGLEFDRVFHLDEIVAAASG